MAGGNALPSVAVEIVYLLYQFQYCATEDYHSNINSLYRILHSCRGWGHTRLSPSHNCLPQTLLHTDTHTDQVQCCCMLHHSHTECYAHNDQGLLNRELIICMQWLTHFWLTNGAVISSVPNIADATVWVTAVATYWSWVCQEHWSSRKVII